MSELILYQTGDYSIWGTQWEIAKPFATNKRYVSVHLENFPKQNRLNQDLVVSDITTSAHNGVADLEDSQTPAAIGQQAKRRGNGK